MSYADAYQSPQPVPGKPLGQAFQYQEMFGYVFQNPNWLMNLLWCGLCILVAGIIPIVPYLVLFGYQFEIIEALHRRRGTTYPDFDTNRLGEYLTRGIWPLLVAFIVGAVVGLLIVMPIFMIGMIVVSALFANEQQIIGMLAMFLLWAGMMVAMAALNFLMVPMILRAGLTQELGEAFNFGWIKHFVSLVWKEILLGGLFLVLGQMVATFVGLLLFCVGIYFTMALVMLAQAHFMWQLYELYLERGGEPIRLKSAAPAPYPVSQ